MAGDTCATRSLPSDHDLTQLVERIRDDDIAAFERVFRTFHAPLCEVVDSYVHSQAVAEEIVQDLLFVIWLKRRVLGRQPLRAYLFAAARNQALHHLRHAAVVRRWSIQAASDGFAAPPADRALEVSEASEAVHAAIDALPPRARLAFVLRSEHEMTYDEVAAAMGISAKGVEKLLAIAKRHLRGRLGSHADSPES